MKLLITGSDGFIGTLLLKSIEQENWEITLFNGDVTNHQDLKKFFYEGCGYDKVLHFAGISNIAECETEPTKAYLVNSVGTFLVVDCIKKYCPNAVLVFASTAQVYKALNAPDNFPIITEQSEVEPSGCYARTKWIAEEYIKMCLGDKKLSYVILRIFNHSHKRQRPDFFMPSVYSQIKSASNGPVDLKVGNVDVYRDIGAVQDLISAIIAVIKAASNGHQCYNVCSGTTKSLRAIISAMADKMNIRVSLTVDPSRVRKNEAVKILGSNALLSRDTGWYPKYASNEAVLIEAFFSDKL